MIVDTGTGRDGVLPEQAVELAKQIAPLENLALRGVMTHEGHLYRCSSVQEVEEQAILAAQKLVAAAQQLRQAGFQIDTVSTGSTPGCYANVAVQGVTEWRPGTYVFNDAQETGLGVTEQDCALTVKATVVSHPAPDRYLLDAGSKVLSEASHPKYGHGIIGGGTTGPDRESERGARLRAGTSRYVCYRSASRSYSCTCVHSGQFEQCLLYRGKRPSSGPLDCGRPWFGALKERRELRAPSLT